MLTHALARFIETKTSEGIQHRSVGQLQLRINAFVTWAKGVKIDEVTPALAQEYRNGLLRKSGISFKTKTDYLAALKQFFCSGQLNPDTWLGRSSACAGGIPSLW
ncbi:hypothetical protein ACSZNT_15385 [Aeromonas veronii]